MDVARKLKTSEPTVCKWRKRFVEQRVPGLLEAPRPNVHRKLGDERVEKVIQATLATIPRGARHWSTRKMARVAGVCQVIGQPYLARLRLETTRTQDTSARLRQAKPGGEEVM